MNSAFVRPQYPEQIIHAYYLASLVFDYLDAAGQINQVAAMLAAFGQGQSVAQTLRSTLGQTAAEFDQAFDAYMRERFALPLSAIGQLGRIMEQAGTLEDLVLRAEWLPQRYELQLQAGLQLLQEGEHERAEAFLLQARDLFPEYAGEEGAYWWLVQLYQKMGRQADALAQLEKMTAINGEHLESHYLLADLLRQQGQFEQAAEVLERALYITPYEIDSHRQLADLYVLLGRWDEAIRERQAVLVLAPTDLSGARYQLASAYYQAGQYAQARRTVLETLAQAPHFAAAQDLLLEVRVAQNGAQQNRLD
jgi:tetratricopeptide (TPR) repeat protein